MSLRADSTVQLTGEHTGTSLCLLWFDLSGSTLTDITYGKPILGGVHISAPNYLQVSHITFCPLLLLGI